MRTPLRAIPAFILLLPLLAAASPALAGSFDGRPKILLHRTDVITKNPCLAAGISDCADAVTTGSLNTPGYVYALVDKGSLPDLGGASFAIEYQDNCPSNISDGGRLDIHSWNSCAGNQSATVSPSWPEPGSGIVLTWSGLPGCQAGQMVIAGYFYTSAYQADTLHVSRNHLGVTDYARVTSCNSGVSYLADADLGSVAYSPGATEAGCNPCDGPCQPPTPTPVPADCVIEPPPPPPPPVSYGPKLLLHVGDVVAKNPCATGRTERCDQANTAGGLSTPSGPFHFVYLLAARGTQPTMSGLLVGIDYETGAGSDMSNGTGVDIFSWTLCASAEYVRATPNSWPAPGGSNIIVWNYLDDCQTSAISVAGYFYTGAYSPDRFRLTPDLLSGDLQVGNCDLDEIALTPADLGYVEFSDGAKARGCNPCLVDCSAAVTVTPTTWSRIKTLTTN